MPMSESPHPPRFCEMDRVKTVKASLLSNDGYVIERELREGEWVYRVSLRDPDKPDGSFDCWIKEDWLEPD